MYLLTIICVVVGIASIGVGLLVAYWPDRRGEDEWLPDVESLIEPAYRKLMAQNALDAKRPK